MSQARHVPEDPIAFIQDRVRHGRILWTYHVRMRLRGRHISREAIIRSLDSYRLVEAYPDDKYLPSYLVLARSGQDALHVLFATDVDAEQVRVVTAYHPDPDEWEPDMRTRRRAP